jgi:cysteine-rich repeat protein
MNFTLTSFLGAYAEDTAYFYPPSVQPGTTAMAEWTFQDVEPGDYIVYATWKKHGAFSKDAKYTAKPASWNGQTDVQSIDQTVEPNGVKYKNRDWKLINTVTVANEDDVVVTVKPGTDNRRYTVADAVMIVKAGEPVSGPSCPTPVCAAPPTGCTYAADPTVGANGCLVNPCGVLQCEPVRPSAPACGDGIVQSGEQCDDGNLRPGDSCSPTCQLATCGDGIVSAGETCDMGGNNGASQGTYMCTAQCAWAYCGDGVMQQNLGEQCDSGTSNGVNGNACARDCKIETNTFCGIIQSGTYVKCEQMTAKECADQKGRQFATKELCLANLTACNDGNDNDGDGLIDLNDKGCANAQDRNEGDGSKDLAVDIRTDVRVIAKGGTIVVSASLLNGGPDNASGPVEYAHHSPGRRYL